MEIGIELGHQNGASYEQLRASVFEAERLGFDLVGFPDHFLPSQIVVRDGERVLRSAPSPTGPSDVWTLMAALVPQTLRIRFATLMTSSTFRHPGVLAVMVGQVNAISGGRVDLGLGANWLREEHLALGVPFPPVGERFDRLEEQLTIITGLWDTEPGSTFEYVGTHYVLESCPPIPRPPGTPRPRIIVGGRGPRRTPLVAARHADEFNVSGQSPDQTQAYFDRVSAACDEIGRDPATLRHSVLLLVLCGADDADTARQLDAADLTPDEAALYRFCSPTELVDLLGRFRERGVDRVIIGRPGGVDPDNLQLIGDQVLPQLQVRDR